MWASNVSLVVELQHSGRNLELYGRKNNPEIDGMPITPQERIR